MSTFQVEVVSAEGQIFSGEATAVYAVAITGEIGILPRHAPLLTKLKPGALRVQTADGVQHLGQCRLHARALPCGEDDDVEVRHIETRLSETKKPLFSGFDCALRRLQMPQLEVFFKS